jgi:dipeptidyl aminopeptidase/acylaminoacyl peptidase
VVVRARRPASVVTVAALLVGLVIAGPPAALAQDPPEPIPPYRIGYVSEDAPVEVPDGLDLWSADAFGQDRTDVTNRPGLDEADPAYSPDGTRLAYTEHGEEGALRIVVSGADGRDPRPLTSIVPGQELQHDPTWSPDGTMIAFSHVRFQGEIIDRSIRIVRVADGLLLGEVRMPAHLQGEDLHPAWSPDGTRLALTRQAQRIPPPPSQVDPPVTERPVAVGGSFTIDKVVRTPVIPPQPDVVLLIDTSGSMGDEIDDVKANLSTIVADVVRAQPEAHFAVASYTGHEDSAHMFLRRIDLTDPARDGDGNGETDLAAAVRGLGTTGGFSEVWAHALRQVASPEIISYRDSSSRVVVLIGDEPNTEGPDPGDTIPNAITALVERGIRVVAVDSGELDYAGEATAVTDGTDGVLVPFDPTKPGQVSQAILDGIQRLRVLVTPVATGCDPGLSVTFAPGEVRVPGGENASFRETVQVDGSAPAGSTLRCTVELRLNGEPSARPGFTQQLSVEVADPRLPVVVVDDVTVQASGPDGAVVDYEASAADARGVPLTPECAPPPGGTFPIGVTTVTCTATDRTGNTGTDTAIITVTGPDAEPSQHIWLVDLARPAPDRIVATNQIDLSVTIGEPCAGDDHDRPAWSPDGDALAFGHAATICVVDAGGNDPRRPVRGEPSPGAGDPAWSPDGALIAFSEPGGEDGHSRLWTVPAAGGEPSLLIDTPGGAAQPAFRRMVDLVVTARATPPSISVGDQTVLEFVVANRGGTTAAGIELSIASPRGLRADEITTTRGSCELPALRCLLGGLAPLDSVTVQLGATGLLVGDQPVLADVDSRDEPNPADNEASVTVTVTPAVVPPPREPPPPTPARVEPPLVERTAFPGTSFTIDKTVHTVGALPDPDVVLLIDDTGSMGSVIEDVRRDMRRLIDQVRAKHPAAYFSIAAYRDEFDGPGLDFRVEQQPIAAETADQLRLLDEALGRLSAEGGDDIPEDWINALHRVATDAIAFRSTSSKIVVLVGDAESHDPSLGHTLDEATGALAKRGVRLIGVPTGAAQLDALGQATRVAEATKGLVLEPTSDPTKVAETIAAGITGLPVTVTPTVAACDPRLTVTFTPGGPMKVPGGQDARFVEEVRVAADAPGGATLGCTVEFRLDGEAAVRPGLTQRITIRVTRPELAVEPAVGPPGLVVRALGTGFPPGAQVRLRWSAGISETPGLVTVRPDGTFEVQVLVFHNDVIGNRELQGTAVTGPPIGTVSSEAFLVVPRSLQPPSFRTRH